MLRLVLPLVGLLAFAVADRGSLEIRSLPGATVVWEGIELGATDADGRLTIGDIPPGTYRVALRKEGFEPLDLEVEIGAGATTVSGNLQPLAPPPARDVTPTTPRPPAAEPQPAPPPALTLPDTHTEPPAPAAAATNLAAAPHRGEPVTPEQATAATAPGLLVWALVAAAAALGAALVRRRLLRAPQPAPGPPAADWDGGRSPDGAPDEPHDPSFLSELKQREMELADTELAADDHDVIDVEVIEVDDAD